MVVFFVFKASITKHLQKTARLTYSLQEEISELRIDFPIQNDCLMGVYILRS